MEAHIANFDLRQISVLLRGEPEPINAWIQKWSARRTALYVAVIAAGAGLYGASMGYWRDPLQALYTGIKFPLIMLLTTVGNGLLNAMLAPLLGLNIGFRQSLQAVLMSFTISAAILGSFSPVSFFVIWNTPAMSHAFGPYSFIQLMHVAVIAFAGTIGNIRLGELLHRLGGSRSVGRRVLLAWLSGNLLLGSQLSWIFRPFIGSPNLPVQFLRAHPFDGNFFETLYYAFRAIFFS